MTDDNLFYCKQRKFHETVRLLLYFQQTAKLDQKYFTEVSQENKSLSGVQGDLNVKLKVSNNWVLQKARRKCIVSLKISKKLYILIFAQLFVILEERTLNYIRNKLTNSFVRTFSNFDHLQTFLAQR